MVDAVTIQSVGNAPLLEVEGAHVRFGKLHAVNNINLRLNGGELLGLIGPNGAGKTTLLRAVVGLQPLTAGVVRILGELLTPESDQLRAHLGFTPDTPAVYEDLTVRAYLRAVARGYSLTDGEADERIAFWLDKVWLTEKAESKIKGLSRGMRQRIGIARTLLPNPSLIVLDEPAAGLDPAGRVQFRELLCMLREQGKALIVSSHILADMDEYCSHIAIMAGGAIMRWGTVAEVAEHQADGQRQYTVMLASEVGDITVSLAAIDGLTDVKVERSRITFNYPGEPAVSAQLLARLVGDGAADFLVHLRRARTGRGVPQDRYSTGRLRHSAQLEATTTMALLGLSNPITYAQFHLRGGLKNHLTTAAAVFVLVAGVMYLTVRLNPGQVSTVMGGWATGLLVGQASLLVIFGGSRVAGSIRKDLASGIIESHRLMPVSSVEVVAGYIGGAVTQALAVSIAVFLLGTIAAGAAGIAIERWFVSNLVLVGFACFVWVVMAAVGFTLKGGLVWIWPLMGMSTVLANLPGGFLAFPGLGVLLSPLQGDSIFSFRVSVNYVPSALAVSAVVQLAVGTIFFISAMKRYRRPAEPPFSAGLGIALVGAWVAVSAIGMVAEGSFSVGRTRPWSPSSPRYIEVLAATFIAMLVAIPAISGAAWTWCAWRQESLTGRESQRRSRPIHPMVTATAIAVVAGVLVVAFPVAIEGTQPIVRVGLSMVVLFAYSASLMLLAWAAHASERGIIWPIGAWLAAIGILPMIADVSYYTLNDQWTGDDPMGPLSSVSPIGALIMLLRYEHPQVFLGLAVQVTLVFVLAAVTRRVRSIATSS